MKLNSNQIEFRSNGPLNDLFLALNYYMSTGDHVGEGIASDAGSAGSPDQTLVMLTVNPADLTDVQDFLCLNARLKQIYDEEGMDLQQVGLGSDGRFQHNGLLVANADIPRLAQLLKAKPGPLGWGSMRAFLIEKGVIRADESED